MLCLISRIWERVISSARPNGGERVSSHFNRCDRGDSGPQITDRLIHPCHTGVTDFTQTRLIWLNGAWRKTCGNEAISRGNSGGRYWIRTSDPRLVRPTLFRWANRPIRFWECESNLGKRLSFVKAAGDSDIDMGGCICYIYGGIFYFCGTSPAIRRFLQ